MSHLLCAKYHSQFPFATQRPTTFMEFRNYPAESHFILFLQPGPVNFTGQVLQKMSKWPSVWRALLGLENLNIFATKETLCMRILPISRWPWLIFYYAAHKTLKVPITEMWQKEFVKYEKIPGILFKQYHKKSGSRREALGDFQATPFSWIYGAWSRDLFMSLSYFSWWPHTEFYVLVFAHQWMSYFAFYLDFLRLKWHFLDFTEMFQNLSLPRWHVLFEIKLKDISLMLLFILNLAIICQSPTFDWTQLSSFL